jgi:hypothetical protein
LVAPYADEWVFECELEIVYLKNKTKKYSEPRDWLLCILMNGKGKVKDETEKDLSMTDEPKSK